MGMLIAFRWYGSNLRQPQATPPRALQMDMIEQLEHDLKKRGERPIACECLAWPRPPHVEPAPGNAVVALLIVRSQDGKIDVPLRTWFAWQHPQWQWSMDVLPDLPEHQGLPA
jgi:hypothetical protein